MNFLEADHELNLDILHLRIADDSQFDIFLS